MGEFGLGPDIDFKAPEPGERQPGLVNYARELINKRVMESHLPTKEAQGYESTVGVYGGKLVQDGDKMIFDMRGAASKIDQYGDRIVRTFDEHHVKKPGATAYRSFRMAAKERSLAPLKKLFSMTTDAKRYRVTTPEQVMENVKRLGLEEHYAANPHGIEIRDPEKFSRSVNLNDIFRQDLINSPMLNELDRFQALGEASKYLAELHKNHGATAEGLTAQYLFEKKENGKVSKPYLMIPTEIYNPEKNTAEIDKLGTDVLDLLVSAAAEEYRRSKSWTKVIRVLDTVLKNYGDIRIISAVKSFATRGRLTMSGDLMQVENKVSPTYKITHPALAAHNTQRLGIKSSGQSSPIRELIIDACDAYLKNTHEKK